MPRPKKIEADSGQFLWLKDLGLETYVALDLETTGLDSGSEQIIEIGAVRFRHGDIEERFQTLLRCGRALDPFITDLTGIRDSDLKGAPRFKDIAKDLDNFLGDEPLVGHNVEFDLGFLSAAGGSVAAEFGGNPFLFPRRKVLDTAMLARTFWPELSRFSLGALSDSFEITLTEKHRAEADATTTGLLLAKIVQQLPERVWKELAEDLQRLVGSTSNRSRFFFDALVGLAEDRRKPVVPEEIFEDSDDEHSPLLDRSLPEILGDKGLFENKLEFFHHRPMQLEMAEAVERCLESNQILFAEAPTGTGKSLAYLVPAVRWVFANPEEARQIVISSNTKGLQDQLFSKDIGEIQKALGVSVRATVLKGRNNYLCKRRLRMLVREAAERLSDLDRIRLMPLLRWSELTTTGDIAETSGFSVKHNSFLWSQVASDAQACAGSACNASKGDFHRMALERFAKAHVVFINHALLMSDLGRFTLRPSPLRKIILDEAHHIERSFVSASTIELSAAAFRNCLLRLADERSARGLLTGFDKKFESDEGAEVSDTKSRLLESARMLFALSRDSFSMLAESLPSHVRDSRYTAKLRYQYGDRVHSQIVQALYPLSGQWNDFSAELRKLERQAGALKGDEKSSPEMLFELKSASDNVAQLNEKLAAVLGEAHPNDVRWLETGSHAHGAWCTLFCAPISVGISMEQSFWPQVDSVVLCSATLTTAGAFSHLKEALGLADVEKTRIVEGIYDSPFDLKNQMRIFVPTYLPSPKGDRYSHESAVTDMVSAIVENLHRGTLVLCTSLDYVDKLSDALEPIVRKHKRTLFSQARGGSPNDLIEAFRKEKNAVLVGAASFWEGIDVVGDALQILIVAKLPFDVPTEPWIEARCEVLQMEARDPFQEFSLPSATLRLKQGIGRLIRHQQDRGVAILADPRLMKSAFGRTIRDSLPVPSLVVQSPEDLIAGIDQFFNT